MSDPYGYEVPSGPTPEPSLPAWAATLAVVSMALWAWSAVLGGWGPLLAAGAWTLVAAGAGWLWLDATHTHTDTQDVQDTQGDDK